jgi:hypothetical protein
MRMIAVLFFYLTFSSIILAQSDTSSHYAPLKFGPNYRIYPGNLNQTEVFIAKSPVDQNVIFSSCNTLNFIPFFISEGIFQSVDGGNSWTGNDTCTGTPIEFHGGDPGIAIDKNGTFIMTRMGRSPFVGLYSHYSSDNGQTWSAQNAISTDDLERAAVATDVNPVHVHYGRTYAVWVKFAPPYPLMFAQTDDGAKHWSIPKPVNNPANRSAGGDVAIGPDGKVYTCWAGVQDVTPFKEILVGFASSFNGGATWNVNENAFEVNGINGELVNKHKIRVNGLPGIAVDTTKGPRRGWIYIVSGQKDLSPAGHDPDIILHRSTDGGQTWSSGIRVNQDQLNNGKTQYFPSVHIDKSGAINIIFYDDRHTTNDSAGVFLARSLDGGDSWSEYEISDHNFQPVPIGYLGQGYQGDNIDITSTDSKLIPVWMDNSSGIYQIWTVAIDFSDVNAIEEADRSSSEGLQQNYPNPFSASTKIGFRITAPGHVSMKIFDVLGNEVAELVNTFKLPGAHSVEFNPAFYIGSHPLTNGVYLVKLSLNDWIETKKMILIR